MDDTMKIDCLACDEKYLIDMMHEKEVFCGFKFPTYATEYSANFENGGVQFVCYKCLRQMLQIAKSGRGWCEECENLTYTDENDGKRYCPVCDRT